jgi:hypothetical protein
MPRHLGLLALLAVAGCDLVKTTSAEGPVAQCLPVSAACARNADCCSYGCTLGTCLPNPRQGGACRTTDDCGYPMTCLAGACAPGGQCRIDADVCDFDNQCCSGNCLGPAGAASCQANRAPILDLGAGGQVPYHRTITLTPSGAAGPATVVYAASDPDADTLVYGWSLLQRPADSAATLSSQTAPTVSFLADVAGDYQLRLTVTDGFPAQPGRLTVERTVTLTAVNTAPVVDAGPDLPAASRNVPVTLAGTVSDPDGDALTCTWKATPPAGSAVIVAGPASCGGTFSGTFTPTSQGTWTATLEVQDATTAAPGVAVHDVADARSITVVNDAPVVSAGPDRAGNEGPPGGAADPVPLQGSASDRTGDVGGPGFTWSWSVVSAPAGSALVPGQVFGTAASAAFVPDVRGSYQVKVTADDGFGGTAEDTAVITVDRHVRPLGTIVAAARQGASDRLVLVGTAPGAATTYRLWVLDPASAAAPVEVALGAEPTCLGLSPSGAEAVVGQKGSHWQWVSGLGGGAPVVSALFVAPYAPTAAAWVDSSRALLAGYTSGTSASALYEAALASGNVSLATCSNCAPQSPRPGTRVVATAGFTAVLDEVADTLRRYDIRNTGQKELSLTHEVASGLAAVDGLWLSDAAAQVFLGNGAVLSASSLSSLGPLPAQPGFVDGRGSGAAFRGVLAAPTSLISFDASLNATSTDALPVLGVAGVGYPTFGEFGFVSASGATRWAVVSAATPGGRRYGLVSLP